MKIMLVQQDMGRRVIKSPMLPIGLSYIASALKEHDVKIFDPNVYPYPRCFQNLKDEIRSCKPEIVGISIRNIDTTQRRDLFVNFKTVLPTIQAIKEVCPEIKIIAGGTGFSIFSELIMTRLQQIDFGVYLEGEKTIVELLENLSTPENVKGLYYRKEDIIQFTGARKLPDFSKIPFPKMDKTVLNFSHYISPLHNVIGIQSKRGCAYNCSYCSYLFLNDRALRLRDPVHVVDEIEYLVTEHNVTGFTFVDSLFNHPQKHAVEICNEIIKRDIKVKWGAWLTPRNLTKEFLLLLRKAGCEHIGFSPDSATDKGMKTLSKGMTEKDLENSLKLARQVKGMAVGYNFFCAYPQMTIKDMFKTLFWFFRIPLLLPGRGGVGLGWIRLEPHTKLYDTALKENIIDENINMLPENEKQLAKLFYLHRKQWYITMIFDLVLFVVEKALKPGVISFYRIFNRLFKKQRSFYDR